MHCRLATLAAVLLLMFTAADPAGVPSAVAYGSTAITFVDSGQRLGQGVSFDQAFGDLDGDIDRDLFIANYWTACKIWMNDGSGYFTNSGQNFGTTSGHGVDLGDLDGDDDLDAFLVFIDGSGWVLLNDGTGHFTDTGQRLGSTVDNQGFVSLADVDGDTDLDAAAMGYDMPNRIWLNDGTGVFTAGPSVGDTTSGPMALGDLDADTDIDIFMMNDGGSTVLLNDGAGNFTDTGQRLGYAESWGDVEVGDLDGDSDLDAFVTNQMHGNTVWLNDGAGNFSAGEAHASEGTEKIALGDLEGDGDLDAFTTNYAVTSKVWLNNGTASFTTIDSLFGIGAVSITAEDMDSDGDLDVIVGRLDGYGPTSVYFNTTPSAGVVDRTPSTLALTLSQNHPNPFGSATAIGYALPRDCRVVLAIYNVSGQVVRTLLNEVRPAGCGSVAWDGTDARGAEAAAGVYFYSISVDGTTITRRMVLVR